MRQKLDKLTQKYVGQYIRLYRDGASFQEGILLGSLQDDFVSLVSFSHQKRSANVQHIRAEDIRLCLKIRNIDFYEKQDIYSYFENTVS